MFSSSFLFVSLSFWGVCLFGLFLSSLVGGWPGYVPLSFLNLNPPFLLSSLPFPSFPFLSRKGGFLLWGEYLRSFPSSLSLSLLLFRDEVLVPAAAAAAPRPPDAVRGAATVHVVDTGRRCRCLVHLGAVVGALVDICQMLFSQLAQTSSSWIVWCSSNHLPRPPSL